MITFKASVAAEVARIPFRAMQTLYERGLITSQPCDIASGGSGNKRGYSIRRLIQIALTQRLIEAGVRPARAAEAAFEFSDRGSSKRAVGELFETGRTFLIGSNNGCKVTNIPPDGSLEDFLPHDGAAYVVNCDQAVTSIKSKLGLK